MRSLILLACIFISSLSFAQNIAGESITIELIGQHIESYSSVDDESNFDGGLFYTTPIELGDSIEFQLTLFDKIS